MYQLDETKSDVSTNIQRVGRHIETRKRGQNSTIMHLLKSTILICHIEEKGMPEMDKFLIDQCISKEDESLISTMIKVDGNEDISDQEENEMMDIYAVECEDGGFAL